MAISGRIYKSNLYAGDLRFRKDSNGWFDPAAPSANDINQETEAFSASHYYRSGLVSGIPYGMSAYIDISSNGQYEYGEPYDEQNVTSLTASRYGLNLVPLDPSPVLVFKDISSSDPNIQYDINITQNECNVTIDVNSSSQTSTIDWLVEASDPYDSNWSVDDNLDANGLTVNSGIRIVVEGNFSSYLDNNFTGYGKIADLSETPIGSYVLIYKAYDSFENVSNILTQKIEVRDRQTPYLTFLDLLESNKYPSGAYRGITTETNSTINNVSVVDPNDYNITYLTDNDANLTWLEGEKFDLANHITIIRDNKDGLIENAFVSYYEETVTSTLLSQEFIDLNDYNGTYQIDGNASDNFKVEIFASDDVGNDLNFTIYLNYQSAGAFSVTVIDGYVSGAEVIFDSNGDGLSDLSRTFYTDEYGVADLTLTYSELRAIDSNGNGKIDPDEGRFIARGGIDTSTGTAFNGVLIADANASVVSPLTTLVAKIMDTGVAKETAIVMTAQALGIDTSINLTTYDPILETALGNDEQAGAVLVANLRMANLINQSEGLLLAIAEEYEGMSIGDQLLDQIAQAILSEPGSQLDMDEVLKIAIPAAIQSVDHAQEFDDLDEMIMLTLITEVDQLYVQSLTDSTPETLMEDQDEILQQSIVLRNAAIVGDIELQEFSLIVLSSEGGSVQGEEFLNMEPMLHCMHLRMIITLLKAGLVMEFLNRMHSPPQYTLPMTKLSPAYFRSTNTN